MRSSPDSPSPCNTATRNHHDTRAIFKSKEGYLVHTDVVKDHSQEQGRHLHTDVVQQMERWRYES